LCLKPSTPSSLARFIYWLTTCSLSPVARSSCFRGTKRPKLVLRVLYAEPRQGAIYFPESLARLAAKVLSGSLVLPR
jgi:hypothetical protein